MNVLVIDDEAIARRMVENTLEDGGYNVITAVNGEQGLELLKQFECQLVVTDWEMPTMNGIDFCKAVRSGDFPHYVYVIMVTARDRPSDTISGLTIGADDYVTKPFNPGELLMRVNTGRRIIGMESREMTIFAQAKLAESRDPETGAHLERVRAYCRTLALQLQPNPAFKDAVDDTFVRLVYETSPLHDIGKVAVPDRIQLKPGKHFDPAIVDTFLAVEDEFVQIRRRHQDADPVCNESGSPEFDVSPCFEFREEAVLSASTTG